MPISSIAQILLRLFALNWIVTGLIQLISNAAMMREPQYSWPLLITPASYLLVGGASWLLSPWLARLAARGDDRGVTLSGITARQLYTAVFVGLGLYFALSSISDAFHGVHSLIHYETSFDYPETGPREFPYEDVTIPVLTLIAGICMITTSRKWAEKLARQGRTEG